MLMYKDQHMIDETIVYTVRKKMGDIEFILKKGQYSDYHKEGWFFDSIEERDYVFSNIKIILSKCIPDYEKADVDD